MTHTASDIRGSRSTRQGAEHWKAQRYTAVANVLLVLWFVWSAVSLSGQTYTEKTAWLSSPTNATLMVLLIISMFHHARLGLQVVIEDYVHDPIVKTSALLVITFATIAMATACIVSIVKVLVGN